MSVCPSIRMENLGCHRMDFHEILFSIIFRKYVYVEKIKFSLKFDKNNVAYMNASLYLWKYLAHYFLE
jgi:hypothetical protein